MVTQRVETRPNIHAVEPLRVLARPKQRDKPFISQHSIIFSNGVDTPSFGERRRTEEITEEKFYGGTPGWRFDPDTRNYVPIGPIKQLRDRYGKFMKEI